MERNEQGTAGDTRPPMSRARAIVNGLLDGGLSVGFAIAGVLIALPAEWMIRGTVDDMRDLSIWEHLMTFGVMGVIQLYVIASLVILSLIAPVLGMVASGVGLLRVTGNTRQNVAGMMGCLFLLIVLWIRHDLWRVVVSP